MFTENFCTSWTALWKRWGGEHNYYPLTSLLTPFQDEQLHSLCLTAIDLQIQRDVAASIELCQHVQNILSVTLPGIDLLYHEKRDKLHYFIPPSSTYFVRLPFKILGYFELLIL